MFSIELLLSPTYPGLNTNSLEGNEILVNNVERVLSRLSRLGEAEGGRLGGPLLRWKEET